MKEYRYKFLFGDNGSIKLMNVRTGKIVLNPTFILGEQPEINMMFNNGKAEFFVYSDFNVD